MRALAPLIAIAALLLAAPAVAQPQMTEEQAAAAQRALDRGTLLYYYDQAAWHGTDDMVAKLDEAARRKVRGWVVDGTPDATEIVFYDDSPDPQALYVAQFRGSDLVSSRVPGAGDDRTIAPQRKAMIAARNTALAAFGRSGYRRCVDKPFNTVVLPPETPGGPLLAYLLTPQTSNSSVPAGGHFLVEIGADGAAGEMRNFTRSCLDLPITESDGRKKPEALVVTHLLDPTPTEIHVFTTFAARLPLYVSTSSSDRIWVVEASGGRARIRTVDPKKKTD